MFRLPPLPFAPESLEPHLSVQTINEHYDVIHRNYVETLNHLIKDTPYEFVDIDELIRSLSAIKRHNHDPRVRAILHAAKQHVCHSFMWEILGPQGENDMFDDRTIECLKNEVKGVFGSGWVWIVPDDDPKSTYEFDVFVSKNTSVIPMNAIYVIDVWEHAYYRDYNSDKGAYVDAYLQATNWNAVRTLLNEA